MSKITLNTNLFALSTQRSLNDSTKKINEVYQRLSTGLRINNASDDAAGLSIATSLETESRIKAQTVRNINDAISALDVVGSALDALSQIVTRQQELSTQAINGTLSTKQRASINLEAAALTQEYNRVVESTKFNGINLLSDPDAELNLNIGDSQYGNINVKPTEFVAHFEGDGTFTTPTTYSITGAYANKVYSGDLSGDGIADIITGSSSTGVINLFTNNGNGYFNPQTINTGSAVLDLRLEDVNNDGNLDILTTHASTMRVYLGNGNMSFNAPSIYAAGTNPTLMSIGDINGDGILDILTSSSSISLKTGSQETTRIDFTNNGVSAQDQITFTNAASLTNGGYFTFTTPSNSYYVWMNIDGTGVDPAQAGTGVLVNLLSSDSASQVAAKVAAVLNPLGDVSSVAGGATISLNRAAVGVTSTTNGNLGGLTVSSVRAGSDQVLFSGEYLNLSAASGNYYVWYNVDGGGGDPLVGGRTGIRVDTSTGATATQIRDATRLAIAGAVSGVTLGNPASNQLSITENLPASIANSVNVNAGGVTVSTPSNGSASSFNPAAD